MKEQFVFGVGKWPQPGCSVGNAAVILCDFMTPRRSSALGNMAASLGRKARTGEAARLGRSVGCRLSGSLNIGHGRHGNCRATK